MFGIGGQELLILFLIVLLLFGADKIPEVARALGKSIRDFKRAAGEIESEIQQVTKHKDLLSGESRSKGDRQGPPSPPKRPVAGGSSGGRGEKAGGKDDDAPEAGHEGGSAREPSGLSGGPGERVEGDQDDAPEARYSEKDTPGTSHRPG